MTGGRAHQRSRFSKKLPFSQFLLLNLALTLGHVIVVLGAGAFVPMLPNVAGSLGMGIPYAVWGQSNYVAAMAAAFLIARPVTRRYGARNTALAAYLTFAVAGVAVIAGLHALPLYTCARTLQGFAAGLSIMPSLALMLDHYTKAHHRVATSLWALATFVPFSLGPAFGGYFAYVVGDWRIMFLVLSAATLLVTGTLWALLGHARPNPREPLTQPTLLFLPFLGAVLAIQMLYNVGILTDLTSRAYVSWWLFAAFCLLAWLFWVANEESATPLIRFSIFRYRNFAFGLALLCIAFFGIQGSVVQYVLRLQSVDGYTAWHAGALFLPLFVFSKPMSLRSHHLLHHGYDPRLLACAAAIAMAASFWWMGGYVRPATWETLLWPQLLEGAALGLFITSMNAIILSNVPEPEQGHAVDVLNSARTITAAWIIALSDVFWDRYAVSARNHLTSPDMNNAIHFLLGQGPDTGLPGSPLFHALAQRLAAQSGWLTFNAMFHVLMIGSAVIAVLVWFASATHISHRVTDEELVLETLGEDL